MSWIKNKYGEVVKEFKEDRAAASITRKKAKAEYYRAREKQQIELARKKALFQSQQRERQLKAKYAPRPARPVSTGLSSGFGTTSTKTSSPGFMSWNTSNAMTPSYFATAKPKVLPKISKVKRKKRKSKKKGSTKYIIKGGVAYPVG